MLGCSHLDWQMPCQSPGLLVTCCSWRHVQPRQASATGDSRSQTRSRQSNPRSSMLLLLLPAMLCTVFSV